ncbi:reverse transcriptase family protein [Clostridium nigeriense]|uniref:reverse transcriptase family protein n=1 Tax=Clostridium nigeriense TaxID=1805470 RepID=UPI003D35351E
MGIWKIEDYNTFFDDILNISEENLKLAIKQNEKNEYYGEHYNISKKVGIRKIYSINKKSKLYNIQKQISRNFLSNIMLADCAYGFINGRSYIDFLIPHTAFYKDKYYLRLDIRDFFGSISFSLLKDVLSHYFEVSEKLSEKEREKLIKYTLSIITNKKKVLQGAITSPLISNIVFRQLDIRIQKYCRKLDIEYSRYADDLLFSSQSKYVHNKAFLKRIDEIVNSKGFNINYCKTIRSEKELSLNGYVIGESVRLSRKKLENISRILFVIENMNWKNTKSNFEDLNNKIRVDLREDAIEFEGKYSLINYLTGNRAFIIAIIKYSEDEKFLIRARKIINRIEKIVFKINSIK